MGGRSLGFARSEIIDPRQSDPKKKINLASIVCTQVYEGIKLSLLMEFRVFLREAINYYVTFGFK